MFDSKQILIIVICCLVTAIIVRLRDISRYNKLYNRFSKVCDLFVEVKERRDTYRWAFNKAIKEIDSLEKELQTRGAVNLFPRGCDRREVYKRLMNIYHPDKPNGCRKMSQEIQKQFKK